LISEENMSDLKLFSSALANSDLFKSLQTVNDSLTGGNSGVTRRRISINGCKFREIVNGEQVRVSKEDNMNIVILNAAPVSRTFYKGSYDPQAPSAPTCWSTDTKKPADDVPEDQRQNATCAGCPMSIKGSGQGNTAACRFQQRLAVAIENDLETVYQLQLPATSLFGEAKDGNMPMQAYARFLNAHNTPAVAIVTNMRFDESPSTPKLFFKAVRPLEEHELETVVQMKDSEEAIAAITMTVAQTDGVKGGAKKPEAKKPEAKKPEAKKPEAKKPAPVVEDDDEEVEEPKKARSKKPAAVVDDDTDLSSIIDDWDD
jgi:hypothetical protein